MRYFIIVLFFSLPSLIHSQWSSTGKPFEDKLDYYSAHKAYQSNIDTSNNDDILSYARVLYYQGKIKESVIYFKLLADRSVLNEVKDLNAFHTAVMVSNLLPEEDFTLRYGHLFSDFGIRGYADSLVYSKANFLLQSTCFNSEEFEDFSPMLLGDKLCIVSSRPSLKSDLGKYKYNNQFYYDLYECGSCDVKLIEDGGNLPKGINSELHDGPAYLDPKNKRFFLTRNIEYADVINLGIVYSESNDFGNWSKWNLLPINSNLYNTQHPFYDTVSDRLYFSSDMPGGFGGFDLYYISYSDSGWGNPFNLGNKINTAGDEVFPYMYNSNLYFSSNGYKTKGGLDIFKFDGRDIQSLKSLNSRWDEYGILFVTDSTGLFTTNRAKGFGYDDVLQFQILQTDTLQSGIFVNTVNQKDLSSTLGVPKSARLEIALFDSKTSDWINKPQIDLEIENILSGVKSEFSFEQDSIKVQLGYLSKDSIFKITIEIEKEGYNSKRVVYKEISPRNNIIDLGKIYLFRDASFKKSLNVQGNHLPTVYFDLDKSYIRKKESFKLDSIAVLLKKNPNTKLEIKAFTDSRASFEYNMKLAESRAKMSILYLTQKGIERQRLVYSVYGETNLVNDCGDDKSCEEQYHQLNRRVEFKLLQN